jgi:hypothetical protein
MAVRQIQQLRFDGKRLLCPDHPNRDLEEARTSSERGYFSMVCTAPLAGSPGSTCMRSAEWPSRQAMVTELKQSS